MKLPNIRTCVRNILMQIKKYFNICPYHHINASKEKKTLSLACQNAFLSNKIAMKLQKSLPHDAIYLASCSNDSEIWDTMVDQYLSKGKPYTSSALLSIILRKQKYETSISIHKKRLQKISLANNIDGLLASYLT